MPVLKDKKEGYLDSPIKGRPAKNPKKDSGTLNEVKQGIERLSEFLSTYLSSFEERLGKIEKQIGSLDNRITSVEKISRKNIAKMAKSAPETGGIRVPSELVEDATRTQPIITKKGQEQEPQTTEAEPFSPELPRPTIPPPTEPTITIPRIGLSGSEFETSVSLPATEIETQALESKEIPLSREVPVAENFFDELRARIDKKSSQLPKEIVYQPKPEQVTAGGTKAPPQAPSEKAPSVAKTEEDIRMVLQRLKDSISKTE